MYATLTVLAGYLAAEIFLQGLLAAAAVFMLGLGEFLFIWKFRGNMHPSLIMEGAVLAGIGLAGEYLSSSGFGGGEFVLLELVLGGVLIGTTLAGRPWLASQMKRISGMSAGEGFAREASLAMGFLFLLHGVLLLAMILIEGSIHVPGAILAFAVLYAVAVFHSRRKQRSRMLSDLPVLKESEEGFYQLELRGRLLGRVELKPAVAAVVGSVDLAANVLDHEFLDALELALRSTGCRALRLTSWEGEELVLEMSGYRKTAAGWNKPI